MAEQRLREAKRKLKSLGAAKKAPDSHAEAIEVE